MYEGLFTHMETMNDPMYGQISYNCYCSNTFKMKLGHNLTKVLVEIRIAIGKEETAEYIIRLAKVIPTGHVQTGHVQLVVIIYRLWKDPNRVEE